MPEPLQKPKTKGYGLILQDLRHPLKIRLQSDKDTNFTINLAPRGSVVQQGMAPNLIVKNNPNAACNRLWFVTISFC